MSFLPDNRLHLSFFCLAFKNRFRYLVLILSLCVYLCELMCTSCVRVAFRSQDGARLIAENLGNSYELNETHAVSLPLERSKYSLIRVV